MKPRGVQIVCTIGPASRAPAVLEGLVQAGMSVARLNFAHGDADQHRETVARIRAASQAAGWPVAILQDLAGPKLRLGEVVGGPVTLAVDANVTLECGLEKGDATRLPAGDPYLPREVRPGSTILLGDGAVELEVQEIDGSSIRCRVVVAGEVSSGKGINASGIASERPILGDRDREALALGVELGVDLVGVSYVRTRHDLRDVRQELRKLGRITPLVAKIETGVALEHLDDILEFTDAVMVARGDLSLEIPYERVPIAQKDIVSRAIAYGRPVITATQMLQSMVSASRPTRAEVTDVANAVIDGTDAVMLSDETAVGTDPVRVCRAMTRIVEETEGAYPARPSPPPADIRDELKELTFFARAAVQTARDVGARAIVAWSKGGIAARMLSRERPTVPIVTPTRLPESYHRLALPYGVRPILAPKGRITRTQLESRVGRVDDRSLLLTMRHQAGEGRRIPLMALVRVGDTDEWARDPDPQS